MKKYLMTIAVLLFILHFPQLISSHEILPTRPNVTWVGEYNSAKISFGRIFQGPQIEPSKPKAMNYLGGVCLWVGAKVSGSRALVSAGDGNHLTGRPEWLLKRWEILDAPVMELDAIEEITLSEYNDRAEFNGHTPMGLYVRQTVYSFENKNYQVFNLR